MTTINKMTPQIIELADGTKCIVLDDFRKLERELAEAREKAAMWKSNHDNQVALKAMLMDRPDLGDRASRISELIRERDAQTKAMSELEKAQNQLSQIHRWIERHNQDGFIDSLTYTQNLDRCVDALYDKLEIAERKNKKSLK